MSHDRRDAAPTTLTNEIDAEYHGFRYRLDASRMRAVGPFLWVARLVAICPLALQVVSPGPVLLQHSAFWGESRAEAIHAAQSAVEEWIDLQEPAAVRDRPPAIRRRRTRAESGDAES